MTKRGFAVIANQTFWFPTYAEAVAEYEIVSKRFLRVVLATMKGSLCKFIRETTCVQKTRNINGNRWKRRFLAREFAEVEMSENIWRIPLLGYYPGSIWAEVHLEDREKFYEDLLKQAGRKNHRKHINHERKTKDSRGCMD